MVDHAQMLEIAFFFCNYYGTAISCPIEPDILVSIVLRNSHFIYSLTFSVSSLGIPKSENVYFTAPHNFDQTPVSYTDS